MRFSLALVAALLPWCSALVPRAHQHAAANIPTPDHDPFYKPPANWEHANQGDILRTREVELDLLSVDKFNYKAAYEILYRTTGAYETVPDTTVTTVIVPHNANKNELVTFLAPNDAVGPQCAPSYSMRGGIPIGTDLGMTYHQLMINTLLDEGYIVTVPDYEGSKGSFGAARLAGRMALDGIKATLAMERLGLSKRTKVVTYGYSGGAIAGGWAAALESTYAPGINTVGYAIGGTPANITGTLLKLDGGLFAGFAITGITGVVVTYKKLADWLQPRLTAAGREAIAYARENCMIQLLVKYAFADILSDKYFEHGATLVGNPAVQDVIGDFVMGVHEKETPKPPVFMYHATHDEVIPFEDAFKTAHDWARHGADVHFEQYTDAFMEHATTEFASIPGLILYTRARMANKPFPKGFTFKSTGNPLEDPDTPLTGLGELVLAIEDIIGRNIGPADSKLKQSIRTHAG